MRGAWWGKRGRGAVPCGEVWWSVESDGGKVGGQCRGLASGGIGNRKECRSYAGWVVKGAKSGECLCRRQKYFRCVIAVLIWKRRRGALV